MAKIMNESICIPWLAKELFESNLNAKVYSADGCTSVIFQTN